MPESFPIAVFVLGGVLLLVSLLGGGFKIFGAEVLGTVGRCGRIAAGVTSVLLIVLAIVISLSSTPTQMKSATKPIGESGEAGQYDPESQFEDHQLGILIANFRQVPLDDLIPYRKY